MPITGTLNRPTEEDQSATDDHIPSPDAANDEPHLIRGYD
ncbi:hypothetical protein A8926_2201 [Saccharopolyspora spinosa]|uniref:Uncharacterized protein n=1 Tax=Saccharopolyspora spinosa TaxID=60894 RepID=A0A2N3XV98_SACSN|nr:hypothetical protein A8926_2201 [Saccharopolyspora spinosa]